MLRVIVVLVDLRGRTLSTLSAETHGRFICTTKFCLSLWTPLAVARGTAPAGAKLLATVRRPDGRPQVTHRGRPLYTFNQDTKPGDVNGKRLQGRGNLARRDSQGDGDGRTALRRRLPLRLERSGRGTRRRRRLGGAADSMSQVALRDWASAARFGGRATKWIPSGPSSENVSPLPAATSITNDGLFQRTSSSRST